MGFSAYGVTQNDDPLSQALRGLIDNAASHEHQIALLWQALQTLQHSRAGDCPPADAAHQEQFQATRFKELVGK